MPETKFMRVHRSFIIPINKVKTIQNKIIQIDEFTVPIGGTYKEEIFKFFQ